MEGGCIQVARDPVLPIGCPCAYSMGTRRANRAAHNGMVCKEWEGATEWRN